MEPWILNPALTEERLRIVGTLVRQGRSSALEVFEPAKGDNGWSLGCVAHRRQRGAVKQAAHSGQWPWLTILEDAQRFVFAIDGVPLRFYRGEGEDDRPAHPRFLRRSEPEIEAAERQALLFPDMFVNAALPWRMAVEVDDEGAVSRIVMVQLDADARVRNPWTIPLDDVVVPFASLGQPLPEGVPLPPPSVSPLTAVLEPAAGDGVS
jgi:hypothetical protein